MKGDKFVTDLHLRLAPGPISSIPLVGGVMSLDKNNFVFSLVALVIVFLFCNFNKPLKDSLIKNHLFLYLLIFFNLLATAIPYIMLGLINDTDIIKIINVLPYVSCVALFITALAFYNRKQLENLGWSVIK